MSYSDKDKAHEVCRLLDQERGKRGVWDSHWDEIAQRLYPNASDYFVSRFRTAGDKRQQEVYDSTGAIALNRFAAILDSMLTPRNQTWHRLVPNDINLSRDRQARLWFEETNAILFKHRYAPTANFSSQNQAGFKSLGAFGNGILYTDALYSRTAKGLRYKNCHLGEIYFMENHQGLVDKVLRHFAMTARQALQKWGPERLPAPIVTAFDVDPEREFYFIHYVSPNENIDPTRLDFKGMDFSSCYVSVEGKMLIEEGGYDVMPYSVSRYEQAENEVYGRSPAMDVLPAVKTLNEQKKTLLKQGHRAVDPVLLAHDDGIIDSFSLKPGSINAGGVSKEGRALVQSLPVGNVNIGRDMMNDEKDVIKDAFLVTLFQILADNPQMTATEVMERTREKGILLAPTLGRQQSERLGPQIERELDVLSKLNLLPPLPPILQEAGVDFKVEYDSPLSRAQRAEEASGLMRTVESALGVVNATGNPEALDHFNWDAIIPELADINAVPVRWRKSMEDIQAIREGRANAAQQQQVIDAAPSMASIAKTAKGM